MEVCMLNFKKTELLNLLNKLKPEDKLQLVGDSGVYIMSFDQPQPRTIVYAIGVGPDCWSAKRATYGGDDGCDDIGTVQQMRNVLNKATVELTIKLTSTQIKMLVR
jgi:hypothetical protein